MKKVGEAKDLLAITISAPNTPVPPCSGRLQSDWQTVGSS